MRWEAIENLPAPVTAIDPGISGAVARLTRAGLTIERDFEGRKDISRAVQKLVPGSGLVVIELVHAMPGEGVCSVFSFGKSTGTAFGATDCCHELAPVEVAPQAWQNYFKALFKVEKGISFKTVTREIAVKVFPDNAELFKRKKDHNSADAALLAFYSACYFQELCARRVLLAEKGAGPGKRRLSQPERN